MVPGKTEEISAKARERLSQPENLKVGERKQEQNEVVGETGSDTNNSGIRGKITRSEGQGSQGFCSYSINSEHLDRGTRLVIYVHTLGSR